MASLPGMLLLLALISIPYSAFVFAYTIWWKPRWLEKRLRLQGVEGTPYKPLFGDMKDIGRLVTEAWSRPVALNHQIAHRVDPFTHNMVHKYGKISLFWNGKTPRLVIKDPEMLKEVLSNKHCHFGKPPLNPEILILARGLPTLEGDLWAKHRRLINPAFHLDKLKGMMPAFTASCRNLIEQWESLVIFEGTHEIDIWPQLQDLTGDIISVTAFGSNHGTGKKILELQKELQVLAMEAMLKPRIPGLRFIPTKKNRRIKILDRKIGIMLRNLVKEKENAIISGQSSGDDLLSLLLQSNNSHTNMNGMKTDGLTIEEVIEECKVFYLAGHETTASLLTWVMIVLAMHPNWQEKAREEAQRTCGRSDPGFEAISHLKILSMIIYEVQRLYSSVITIYQHAYKETKVGNIYVPAGVDIILPLLLMNHDPDIWGEDAQEFIPERFSEGVSKASNGQFAFFPFGWGPRTCIGQNFAMIEAKVALAMILQHFSFELSPSYAHAPYTIMTLQPQHGAQLLLNRV